MPNSHIELFENKFDVILPLSYSTIYLSLPECI